MKPKKVITLFKIWYKKLKAISLFWKKKLPTQEELFERLVLFNQKVDKLESLSFARDIAGSKFTMKGARGEGFVIERKGPKGEQFDAFILTLRLFMQDNDNISVRKIKESYDILPISNDLKQQFNDSRDEFNKYLDQPSSLSHNNHNFTHREIIEIMLYGEYAHITKRKIYHTIMNFGFMGELYNNEFVHIAGNFLSFLRFLQELNLKAMGEVIDKVSNTQTQRHKKS